MFFMITVHLKKKDVVTSLRWYSLPIHTQNPSNQLETN